MEAGSIEEYRWFTAQLRELAPDLVAARPPFNDDDAVSGQMAIWLGSGRWREVAHIVLQSTPFAFRPEASLSDRLVATVDDCLVAAQIDASVRPLPRTIAGGDDLGSDPRSTTLEITFGSDRMLFQPPFRYGQPDPAVIASVVNQLAGRTVVAGYSDGTAPRFHTTSAAIETFLADRPERLADAAREDAAAMLPEYQAAGFLLDVADSDDLVRAARGLDWAFLRNERTRELFLFVASEPTVVVATDRETGGDLAANVLAPLIDLAAVSNGRLRLDGAWVRQTTEPWELEPLLAAVVNGQQVEGRAPTSDWIFFDQVMELVNPVIAPYAVTWENSGNQDGFALVVDPDQLAFLRSRPMPPRASRDTSWPTVPGGWL